MFRYLKWQQKYLNTQSFTCDIANDSAAWKESPWNRWHLANWNEVPWAKENNRFFKGKGCDYRLQFDTRFLIFRHSSSSLIKSIYFSNWNSPWGLLTDGDDGCESEYWLDDEWSDVASATEERKDNYSHLFQATIQSERLKVTKVCLKLDASWHLIARHSNVLSLTSTNLA